MTQPLKKAAGFTLIEVLLLLIVTGLVANVLVLILANTARNVPNLLKNAIALQAARECMDWISGQRQLNGYASITCPSSSKPTFCTSPAGYTVGVSIACTTLNGDSNYKTVTVTVSGSGNATLSTLLASY
jgi:type II secretory pathway pseudopilin PulG